MSANAGCFGASFTSFGGGATEAAASGLGASTFFIDAGTFGGGGDDEVGNDSDVEDADEDVDLTGICNFPLGTTGAATEGVALAVVVPKNDTAGMVVTGVSGGGGGLACAAACCFCFCSSDCCKASKLNYSTKKLYD